MEERLHRRHCANRQHLSITISVAKSRDTSCSRWGMMRSPRSYLVSAHVEAFHTNALNHQKGPIWTFQRNTVKGRLPCTSTTSCCSVRPQRPMFWLLSPLLGKYGFVLVFFFLILSGGGEGVDFLVPSFRNKSEEVDRIAFEKAWSCRWAATGTNPRATLVGRMQMQSSSRERTTPEPQTLGQSKDLVLCPEKPRWESWESPQPRLY